jgi:hypothetical protein
MEIIFSCVFSLQQACLPGWHQSLKRGGNETTSVLVKNPVCKAHLALPLSRGLSGSLWLPMLDILWLEASKSRWKLRQHGKWLVTIYPQSVKVGSQHELVLHITLPWSPFSHVLPFVCPAFTDTYTVTLGLHHRIFRCALFGVLSGSLKCLSSLLIY